MNYAEKHKLAFIEASAKNGENVDMVIIILYLFFIYF